MIESIARVVNVYEAKGPRPPHTMTHDPVYPVMTFSEFLASKTYLGGKKNDPAALGYGIVTYGRAGSFSFFKYFSK